jgi:hypothetical protein
LAPKEKFGVEVAGAAEKAGKADEVVDDVEWELNENDAGAGAVVVAAADTDVPPSENAADEAGAVVLADAVAPNE